MSNYNITKYGLIFLFVGVLLGIITTISLFVTNGEIQALSSIQLFGMIFFLVALILMVVGGYGLKEYGEKHGKFTLYALIIFLITIGVGVAFLIMTIMMAFNSIKNSGNINDLRNLVYFGPVFGVLITLIYLFLLHEILDKKGKIILYIASIIAIIVAIIIAIQSLQVYDELYTGLDFSTITTSQINELSQESTQKTSVIGIYNIIHNILLLVAIILPIYQMSSGELKPIQRKTKRICNNCGFEVPEYSDTCPKCGQFYGAIAKESSQVFKYCPECGHQNEEGKTFCEECGAKF